jgi:hypothetical protein
VVWCGVNDSGKDTIVQTLRPTPITMGILARQKEVCLSSTVDILPLLSSSLQQHHTFGAGKQGSGNSRRQQAGNEMHRGERKCIFAIPPSSKAKCLPLLPSLLEDELSMHSDLDGAVLLLHGVVGLSLKS